MEMDEEPPDPEFNFQLPKGKFTKKFLMLTLQENPENKTFKDINPFKISRTIKSYAPQTQIKILKSGDILLEIPSEKDYINLKNFQSYEKIPVKFSYHRTLNFSKGIITCDELLPCEEKELVSELKQFNIVAAKRIYKTVNDVKKPTASIILTFDSSELPKRLILDFLSVKVVPYIKPLQCFKCYKFRHGIRNCKSSQKICGNCGGPSHGEDKGCEFKCIHCGGPHGAWSPSCPIYKQEKKIEEIRKAKNISYREAEAILQISPQQNSDPGQSQQSQTYSQATTGTPVMNSLLDAVNKLTSLVNNLCQRMNVLESKDPFISNSITPENSSNMNASTSKTPTNTSNTLTKSVTKISNNNPPLNTNKSQPIPQGNKRPLSQGSTSSRGDSVSANHSATGNILPQRQKIKTSKS